MSAFSRPQCNRKLARSHLTVLSMADSAITQIRLRLVIPLYYREEPVISYLVLQYGLTLNITSAILGVNTDAGQFDLEISGTVLAIQQGLVYLQSIDCIVIGKASMVGDGWYC